MLGFKAEKFPQYIHRHPIILLCLTLFIIIVSIYNIIEWSARDGIVSLGIMIINLVFAIAALLIWKDLKFPKSPKSDGIRQDPRHK